MIVLDTDALIELIDKRSPRGDEVYMTLSSSGEEVATTSLNLHEVVFGLLKYGKRSEALDSLPVLPFEEKDALLSARLEEDAERRGRPVMRLDAMIAAVAIDWEACLYTFNRRHFEVFAESGLRLI
jgi:tRNA(fMet)-specific endonuclease VapC